jgi:parallel beta-helix repeat protein
VRQLSRKITKSITLLLLGLFLISSFGYVNFVKANPAPIQPEPFYNIYIRADGSIDPVTAPIQRSGTIYSVTSNINFTAITVQCSGITLDGKGFEFSNYERWNTAITLDNVNDVTIKNFKISKFATSVNITKGSGIILTENTFNGKGIGIYTTNCQITNNTFIDYSPGFPYYGDTAIYGNCSYTIISGNNFLNFDRSVFLKNSDNNVISKNYFLDRYSIYLSQSNNNLVSRNSLAMAGYQSQNEVGIGIWLSYMSTNNTISENTISGKSGEGLYINKCSGNLAIKNLVTKNAIGIKVDSYMIGETPRNNLIYQNNFIDNTLSVTVEDGGNIWDNGTVGNFWSDHLSNSSYWINTINFYNRDSDNHPSIRAFDLDTPNQQYTQQPTQTPNPNSPVSYFDLAIILGAFAGAVIVSIALLIIYRKQTLKRKDKQIS